MQKEDKRQEYLKQALKLKSYKKQCLLANIKGILRGDFNRITNRIQKNRYQNEVEKKEDEKKLKNEVQNIRANYMLEFRWRKNHDHPKISPDYMHATQIMNHKKQDKLVHTLANYVKHKNEHYIQVLN